MRRDSHSSTLTFIALWVSRHKSVTYQDVLSTPSGDRTRLMSRLRVGRPSVEANEAKRKVQDSNLWSRLGDAGLANRCNKPDSANFP